MAPKKHRPHRRPKGGRKSASAAAERNVPNTSKRARDQCTKPPDPPSISNVLVAALNRSEQRAASNRAARKPAPAAMVADGEKTPPPSPSKTDKSQPSSGGSASSPNPKRTMRRFGLDSSTVDDDDGMEADLEEPRRLRRGDPGYDSSDEEGAHAPPKVKVEPPPLQPSMQPMQSPEIGGLADLADLAAQRAVEPPPLQPATRAAAAPIPSTRSSGMPMPRGRRQSVEPHHVRVERNRQHVRQQQQLRRQAQKAWEAERQQAQQAQQEMVEELSMMMANPDISMYDVLMLEFVLQPESMRNPRRGDRKSVV